MGQFSSELEGLESRRHLSASLKAGVLRGIGDAGINNTISVAYNTEKTQYVVTVNGVQTSFDIAGVRRIILHGAELDDSLTISSELVVRENIFGYDGNDTISGGSHADELRVVNGSRRGARGWCRLWGMGGNDSITATGGRDFLDGGIGDDVINGSEGRDLIAGFKGNDTINAGGGKDIVYGGAGADDISLGTGDDLCFGGVGADSLDGDDGDDRIFGQDDNDTIHGGNGDDALFGILGADSLFGEVGDDTLVGGGDTDTLDGGEGNNSSNQNEDDTTDDQLTEAESETI